MELTARLLRPMGMMHSPKARADRRASTRRASTRRARTARGLVTAGTLTVAVAGCGSYVATGAGSGHASSTASTTSTTSATGCASVDLATKVTVLRAMHLVEPTRMGALEVTQTNPAKVRALFRDFCQIVSHKDSSATAHSCPMEIGLSYGGTFYDGTRKLATYTYAASGCEIVTVTAPGKSAKPESAIVYGTAAAAAPKLHTDMDTALGLSETEVFQPQTHVNQGSGASK